MAIKLNFDVTKAEVAKRVTLPFIKQKVGIPAFVYFLEPYCKSAKMAKDGDDKQEATLGHVINLTNGDESELILSTVTKSLLDEKYSDGSYVGRAYRIELFAVEGKKYHKVDMVELKLSPEDKAALDAERKAILGITEEVKEVVTDNTPEIESPTPAKKGK